MSIHRRFLAAHWGVDLYAKFLILALWGHTLKLLNRWQWNLAHCRGARVHTILQNFTKITHGSIQSSGKFLNFDSFGARDPHPSTDKVEIWQGSANPRSVAEAMDPDCHPYKSLVVSGRTSSQNCSWTPEIVLLYMKACLSRWKKESMMLDVLFAEMLGE